MRELETLEYDLKFKNNISSIHSISIDTEYNMEDNNLNGNFIITGDYKTNSISINLTDFTFTVPFNHHFENEVINDSVKIEIEDFVYDAKKDNLNVNIEYYICYDEKIVEQDECEIENILNDDEYDLIDFREEVKGEVTEKLDKIDEIAEEIIDESKKEDDRNMVNEMISDINESEEYITYHVYVVSNEDSLESIINKFNISIDTLRDYNDFDEIKCGMKLIIPNSNE